MSATSENVDDNEQQKSKKPADTAFKQQRLPAWQPIITAKTALPVFLIIAIAFIAIGIALVMASQSVQEFSIDYTDDQCLSNTSTGNATTCAQYLINMNNTGAKCYCVVNLTLVDDFNGDIYFYYGLVNYYQNHRRYVRSRDDNQLLGNTDPVTSDCQPFQRDNNQSKDYAPCGAIANSKFNDTLNLYYNGTLVPVTNLGIAWSTDKDVKFQNPKNAAEYFTNQTVHPPNWQITAWQLDPSNVNNTGFVNEDFIVWMRTAAMPTFRKLYRKLLKNPLPAFQNGLPKGTYTLNIEYNYPVSSFSGRKQFIISTTSWMGGKNPFLGWAYITVGIICFITFFIFLVLHKTWKTSNQTTM